MHVDRESFRASLKRAVFVSKTAPRDCRQTRLDIQPERVHVTTTDGTVWYERVLPRTWGPPDTTTLLSSEPISRALTHDSEILLKASRRCHDLNRLYPGHADQVLSTGDPRLDITSIISTEGRPVPLDLLEAAVFSAERGRARPHINSVQLAWRGDKLLVESTDGHRATRAWTNSNLYRRAVVVPLRTVECVLEVFGSSGTVSVRFSDEAVQFGAGGNETVSSRTIRTAFPPFDQVFPTEFSGIACGLDSQETSAAVHAVGSFTGSYVDIDVGQDDFGLRFVGAPTGVRIGSAECVVPAIMAGIGSIRVDAYGLEEAVLNAPGTEVALSIASVSDLLLVRAVAKLSTGDPVTWEHVMMSVKREPDRAVPELGTLSMD